MSRVLVITRNLPPLVGGMERLIWHMIDELRHDHEIHVVGPAGCRPSLPADVSVTEIPLKPFFWYLLRTMIASLWCAVRARPALVLAGSGLTAPFAWLSSRLVGARSMVYLHGLDIETTHPAYRFAWQPFLRASDRVVVNSSFTRELAFAAGVRPERSAVLNPGVQLPDMAGAAHQRRLFRERHGLKYRPVMLYVGRITARKGLAPFVQDILPDILTRHPQARLVVIGEEPARALLRSTGERARIEASLARTGLRSRVLFLGELAHDDPVLDAAYFAADVLVFPVQKRTGDNEGFGMVALEAAAHGLPTVAFSAGGVSDAVRDGVSGTLVPAGDNAAFALAVAEYLDTKDTGWSTSCRQFASGFAWPEFGRQLRQISSPE